MGKKDFVKFLKPEKGKIHVTLDGKITLCSRVIGKNWIEVEIENFPKDLTDPTACMYCHAVWRVEHRCRSG